jgi:hypothetical protein
MKHVFVLAALLAALLAVHSTAQEPQEKPADNMNIVRDAIRAERKVLVAENMQLTESEAKAFWPVYDEYEKEMKVVGDRMVELVQNYATTHNVMTDDTAGKLLDKMLSIQSDRVKLQQTYLPKFKKVLPLTKVARFYQIENKIRAVVDYDLAGSIPLVK